jgi:hypothetical protein
MEETPVETGKNRIYLFGLAGNLLVVPVLALIMTGPRKLALVALLAAGGLFLVGFSQAASADPVEITGAAASAASSTLTWTESTSADFLCYRVVRSTDPALLDIAPPLPVDTPSLGVPGLAFVVLLLLAVGAAAASGKKKAVLAVVMLAAVLGGGAYRVVHAAGPDPFVSSCIASKSTLTYTDFGLETGTTYYYRVYVEELDRSYTPSSALALTTADSNQGVVLAGTTTPSTSVTLSWSESMVPEGEFGCYRVLRSDSTGFSDIGPLVRSAVPVPALGPAGLIALALCPLCLGISLISRRKSARIVGVVLTLVVAGGSYQAVRAAAPTPYLSPCITPKSTVTYTDDGLDPSTIYYYKIYVMLGAGGWEASNEIAVRTAAFANQGSPLGVNLEYNTYWAPDWIFVDVFHTAQRWLPQVDDWPNSIWDTGEYDQLDLDANGWVRSLPAPDSPLVYRIVGTIMLNGEDQYPAGQYVVLYDGEGTIEYDSDATKNETLSAPGRDVVDVTPLGGGIHLKITETDPNQTGEYIRNIRVITPGGSCSNERTRYCEDSSSCVGSGICQPFEQTYATELFHPYFLRTIERFKVVRFMNWLDAWYSTVENWNDRPQVSDYSWSDTAGGVPIEVAVELSNKLDVDPWINVVARATDDYIREQAILVRDSLKPNLEVYLEYTNEAWNTSAGQGDWIEAQGEAKWPASSEPPLTKRINWYGKRSAEMCTIWKTEWGIESDRVICVMGAHGRTLWTATTALDCSLWAQAPCSSHGIDAVGMAPYFGGYLGSSDNETTVESWTNEPDGGLDLLFDELTNGGRIPGGPSGGALQEAIDAMQVYRDEIVVSRGFDVVAYEGGQHLVGVGQASNNTAITGLFVAANRTARMGIIYGQYLDAWRDKGFTVLTHYSSVTHYSKWGSWGLKEHLFQTNSPKYQEVKGFIGENPCWWTGCE